MQFQRDAHPVFPWEFVRIVPPDVSVPLEGGQTKSFLLPSFQLDREADFVGVFGVIRNHLEKLGLSTRYEPVSFTFSLVLGIPITLGVANSAKSFPPWWATSTRRESLTTTLNHLNFHSSTRLCSIFSYYPPPLSNNLRPHRIAMLSV